MAKLPIEQVKRLYYDQEMTVEQVGKELGVTSSIVFKFMKKEGLQRRPLVEINRKRFENSPLSFQIKRNLTVKEEQLKVAGIMLYWGEGTKRGHNVDFANSNSDMILVFLQFLREICGVDEKRLRIYLYCYADQDIEMIKNYWSKITNIPLSQFTKPYIRKDFHKKNGREMKYGMVHGRYSDKRLLLQIENWIKEYIQTRVGTQAANGVTL